MEETEIEINTILLQLDRERLLEACRFLNISEISDKLSKLKLIKQIMACVDENKLKDLEDKGMSVLLELLDKVNELNNPSVNEPASNSDNHDKCLNEIATVKREFKISGQIGQINQKDKLSFPSPAHQIDNGVQRGYKDSDIVDAVIRAITPGLRLRQYLEGRCMLDLPSLRRILRSHFQEKNPTELYQILSTTSQETRESSQDFLIRVLDLKQKILFASQEADSGITYDPVLVKRMCLHAVQTGLISDFVRSELKHELSDPGISDEELIEKVNSAARQEEERKIKLKRPSKTGSIVAQVETDQNSPQSDIGKTTAKGGEKFSLKSELDSIKAEILSIKQTMNTPVSNGQQQRQKSGCYNCRKSGLSNCKHCWSCGSGDHFRFQCPKRQGNDQGALSRDGQQSRD